MAKFIQRMIDRGTYEGDKVPRLTRILFPWSGIFRDACYQLVGTFLTQYALTSGVLDQGDAFSAQYGVITIALMLALIWDGINDPIMGFIIEKFRFKLGKFRPWIEIGAIGNTITVLLMFIIPSLGLVHGWGYVIFMIVMYFIWDLMFTMNDIGYWSMLPALTNDQKQRAKISTSVTIAASIGTFLAFALLTLSPGNLGSYKEVFLWASIGISLTFLITQSMVFFLCKEKKRDPKQEEVSEKSHFLDLFRVVIKNKELRSAAIAMFLYYAASGLLTGVGTNYYYFVYGYPKGATIATIISVFYIVGTIAAQAFYPLLAKKISKKNILLFSVIIIALFYGAFFFLGFPMQGRYPLLSNENAFGWQNLLLYFFAFTFFAASSLFYLALIVMFQDAIDYNEYAYGERKESICFAWRPLDAKLSSGLNLGIRYFAYFAGGFYGVFQLIGNAEAKINSNPGGATPEIRQQVNDEINAQIDALYADGKANLLAFGIIIIGITVALYLASYLIMRYGYHITEEDEKKMVEELAKRNEANIAKEEQAVVA